MAGQRAAAWVRLARSSATVSRTRASNAGASYTMPFFTVNFTPPARSTLAVGVHAPATVSVEHLQIRQRILIDHQQVGQLADLDAADVVVGADQLRTRQRRRPHDLQGTQAGLAQ